ncbi:alpha/beta fold hydrolase [Lonepinella sp. BR2271]|uniref:alpha/beta fold hydrolase n=1 Tax=Lonepinella sp. BR2271 TaxID=3434550 RepID=UPI003F6E0C82
MSAQQLLNYQFSACQQDQAKTIVFIHGLFGDMNNLGIIARAFSEKYHILRLDLRNHGQSFHSDEMNYDLMAQDVIAVLNHLQLNHVILVGHSMGGKTAMRVAHLRPDLLDKLIVIDIAPVRYQHNWHNDVFMGLLAVKQAKVDSRQQAKPLLAEHIKEESIQQFMLKSFDPQAPEKFRFNTTALYQHYTDIMDWQAQSPCQIPTLFIKGGLSDYIHPDDSQRILAQFPQATSFTVNGAGHWIHAEKPDFVVRAIERFLQSH